MSKRLLLGILVVTLGCSSYVWAVTALPTAEELRAAAPKLERAGGLANDVACLRAGKLIARRFGVDAKQSGALTNQITWTVRDAGCFSREAAHAWAAYVRKDHSGIPYLALPAAAAPDSAPQTAHPLVTTPLLPKPENQNN